MWYVYGFDFVLLLESNIYKYKYVCFDMINKNYLLLSVRIMVFSCLFLSLFNFLYDISSVWISFLTVLIAILILTCFIWFRDLKFLIGYLCLLFLPFLYLIVINFNYIFIILLSVVLGVLLMNIIKPELRIWVWFYSLIGILLFLHVIWWNYLPFGYSEELVLDVGSSNDLNGKIYLVESEGLGPRICIEKDCYREINGSVEVRFDPKIVIDNNTYMEIEIDGEFEEDVFIIINGNYQPIYLKNQNFSYSENLKDSIWDFSIKPELEIDFTKNLEEQGFIVINETEKSKYKCNGFSCYENDTLIEKEILVIYGNMIFENITKGLEFDGIDDKIELLGSYDRFENESFILNVVGEIFDINRNTSQIVGHFNWEIIVQQNKVNFMLGRMENSSGPFYTNSVKFENERFDFTYIYDKFEKKDVFNSNVLVSRKEFKNESIFLSYNSETNLGFGYTRHNYEKGEYFKGRIEKFIIGKIENFELISPTKFNIQEPKIYISGVGKINDIKYRIFKNDF